MLDQWWASVPPEVHASLYRGGLDNPWVAIGLMVFFGLGLLGLIAEYAPSLLEHVDYTLIVLILAVWWGNEPRWLVWVYLLSAAHFRAGQQRADRIIAAIERRARPWD